jgi:CRP-like cAMP-binding protein
MTVNTVRDALTQTRIVAGLEAADIAALAEYGDLHQYPPGSWLFHESASCEWVGMVVHGVVELVDERAGDQVHRGVAEAGAVLGAGALFDMPHVTSAYTSSGVTVLRWLKVAVSELRCTRPKVFSHIGARVPCVTGPRP